MEDEKAHDKVLQELPWLGHLDMSRGYTSEAVSRSTKRLKTAESWKEDEPERAPEDVALEVMAALDRARVANQEVVLPDIEHFGYRARGGPALYMKTGTMVDAVQASAMADAAKEFCARRRLQQTFKATFSKHG